MLQALKVFVLRHYYRFISKRAWRGHDPGAPPGLDLQLPPEAGSRPARLYSATDAGDKPLIIYFHGGGWVIGDLDTHDPFCRALSARTGCSVLAVDYRLAPEHPFPAAQEDAQAAARWAAANPREMDAPFDGRLVIAGDSAGGNLTICTCLEASPATRAKIRGAITLYPVTDHYSPMPPSYIERARGQTLTSGFMFWFWDTYLAGKGVDESLRAMPARTLDTRGLPPTFLVTAEYDPLRDEGVAWGERLLRDGVPLHNRHYPEAAHGFACSEGPGEDFERVMGELAAWIRSLE